MAAKGKDDTVSDLLRRIYAVAREIPRGRVATNGQVAELAGIPGGARVAGTAMRSLKESTVVAGVPWHRVVGKKSRTTARVSIRDPVGGAIQRRLREAEGVEVTAAGGIRGGDCGWLPVS